MLPQAPGGGRPDALTFAAFVATAVLAGTNPVAIRLGYAELAPFWWGAVRFLTAALILGAVVAVRRRALPRGRALAGVAIFGALNFGLAFSLTYFALTEVTAATTQVVLALVPLLTLTLATVQRIERFRWWGLVGAVVAAAGVYLVVSRKRRRCLPGGAACPACRRAVARRGQYRRQEISAGRSGRAGRTSAWRLAELMMLVLSLIVGEPWVLPREPATQLSLLYLILLGSIGMFVLYLFVLGRWTATGTSYSWLLAPPVTVILGVVILGEPVTPWFVVGGALVLAGVYVGAFTPAARPAARGNR